jgi:hypothetical protein
MTRRVQSPGDLALLERLSYVDGHWLAGELQSAGIPAWIEQPLRNDDFAVSQRLIAAGRVDVHVPVGALETAREILAGARAAGQLRPAAAPLPARGPTRRQLVILLLWLVGPPVLLLIAWLVRRLLDA